MTRPRSAATLNPNLARGRFPTNRVSTEPRAVQFTTTRRSFATDVVAVLYTDTTVRTSLLADPITKYARHSGLELLGAVVIAHGELRTLSTDHRATSVQPEPTPNAALHLI